ncbi:ATP-binding protein [Ectopseudomonas guguanensis]|uniref:ATP-binding protein n=1 Tax=Ectopseudomonas guguanensis TaxID=1198456 RepID=UPI0028ADC570|nr:ATP-binding protein [Pseudomonas guguanensis]
MIPLLLRTLLALRQPRQAAPPAYRQALLELPLRLLQQGGDAPLLAVLAQLVLALEAEQACLLLPKGSAAGWRRLGGGAADAPCVEHAALPAAGQVQLCRDCLARGRFHVLCGLQHAEGRKALLLVSFASRPATWQRNQLRDIARRLGEVLQAFAEDRRLRRRELSAERGLLARELHDSVAQQLGYLQIRTARLHGVLGDARQAELMLEDLRHTLHGLHRQVRELISGARLTMDGRTLRQALEASVAEFARNSSCVFSLDNRLPDDGLPAQSELQVLQIVREALANVVRHSHARQVQIRLWPTGNGFEVEVRDDGVGLPADLPDSGHFGLSIMRERAAAIGAELLIASKDGGGTRVQLRWRRP